MFVYCTERLRLSEPEAYLRITVARAARKHPMLLAMLRDGRLHLSGVALLAPLLTEENRDAVLERARNGSKRRIEELVAELSPRPDAPSLMRKLPQRAASAIELGPDAAGNAAATSAEETAEPGSSPSRAGVFELGQGGIGAVLELRRTELRRGPPCVRRGKLPWSPCRPAVTRCSSRPARSCAASSSDCKR